jgi:hypothetical protein
VEIEYISGQNKSELINIIRTRHLYDVTHHIFEGRGKGISLEFNPSPGSACDDVALFLLEV